METSGSLEVGSVAIGSPSSPLVATSVCQEAEDTRTHLIVSSSPLASSNANVDTVNVSVTASSSGASWNPGGHAVGHSDVSLPTPTSSSVSYCNSLSPLCASAPGLAASTSATDSARPPALTGVRSTEPYFPYKNHICPTIPQQPPPLASTLPPVVHAAATGQPWHELVLLVPSSWQPIAVSTDGPVTSASTLRGEPFANLTHSVDFGLPPSYAQSPDAPPYGKWPTTTAVSSMTAARDLTTIASLSTTVSNSVSSEPTPTPTQCPAPPFLPSPVEVDSSAPPTLDSPIFTPPRPPPRSIVHGQSKRNEASMNYEATPVGFSSSADCVTRSSGLISSPKASLPEALASTVVDAVIPSSDNVGGLYYRPRASLSSTGHLYTPHGILTPPNPQVVIASSPCTEPKLTRPAISGEVAAMSRHMASLTGQVSSISINGKTATQAEPRSRAHSPPQTLATDSHLNAIASSPPSPPPHQHRHHHHRHRAQQQHQTPKIHQENYRLSGYFSGCEEISELVTGQPRGLIRSQAYYPASCHSESMSAAAEISADTLEAKRAHHSHYLQYHHQHHQHHPHSQHHQSQAQHHLHQQMQPNIRYPQTLSHQSSAKSDVTTISSVPVLPPHSYPHQPGGVFVNPFNRTVQPTLVEATTISSMCTTIDQHDNAGTEDRGSISGVIGPLPRVGILESNFALTRGMPNDPAGYQQQQKQLTQQIGQFQHSRLGHQHTFDAPEASSFL
ncbi:unnamed protein product [Protopolystoma xenopodis]|uniref:Uncharacterized protein n=1 Tax=Protopolystoma xenopodis TaxID=117903 RepID=A0A448WBE0_9PLAT|nr:unnamed protein product [Protopolystoma xenopodis]